MDKIKKCDCSCDCLAELARRRAMQCGGRPGGRGQGEGGKGGCSAFLACCLKAIGFLGLMMWILRMIFYKRFAGSGSMKGCNTVGGASRGIKGKNSCGCAPCPVPPPKKC